MNKYSIVFAEDEKLIRTNIMEKLSEMKHLFEPITPVSNGKEALDVLSTSSFDILITDIRMPAIDGLALSRMVRAKYPGTKIIILSGYAEFSYAQEAIKLGISQYLLKPVKKEELFQVLHDMYQELEQESESRLLDSLRSSILYNIPFQAPLSLSSAASVMLLNAGNICTVSPSSRVREYYNHFWKEIFPLPLGLKYYYITDSQPTFVYLILPFHNAALPERTASRIYDYLSGKCRDVSINLYYSPKPVPWNSLYETCALLKHTLTSLNVCDHSSLVDVQDIPPVPYYPDIQDQITAAAHAPQSALSKELNAFLSSYVQVVPQTTLCSYCIDLFNCLCSYHSALNDNERYYNQYQILDRMSLPNTSREIAAMIWDIISPLLLPEQEPLDNSPTLETVEQICSYIEKNAMQDLTLQGIASHFNFNPTYLIKIFKNEKDDTPINYLIKIRIKLACDLLTNRPDLNIKAVCSAVGYADQHYFSRIFKNAVGVTPSEYRKRDCK